MPGRPSSTTSRRVPVPTPRAPTPRVPTLEELEEEEFAEADMAQEDIHPPSPPRRSSTSAQLAPTIPTPQPLPQSTSQPNITSTSGQ